MSRLVPRMSLGIVSLLVCLLGLPAIASAAPGSDATDAPPEKKAEPTPTKKAAAKSPKVQPAPGPKKETLSITPAASDAPIAAADEKGSGEGATAPTGGTGPDGELIRSDDSASDHAQPNVKDDDPRALERFRPQLDPYGRWGDDPKYGRVWVPDRAVVGEGFSPYVTSGHWALDTGNNWVWVSDFPFGDVVFHYGRWVWTEYGWSWVPGYVYSPAWVVWRVPTGPYAYVGWAPAPPVFGWWGGVGIWYGWHSPYYWVFCPSMYAFAPYPYRYIVTSPAHITSLGHYTRNYVGGSSRTVGPPLTAARIPTSSAPSSRIARTGTAPVGAPQHWSGASSPSGPTRATSLTRPVSAPSVADRGAPTRVTQAPGTVAPPRVVHAPSSSRSLGTTPFGRSAGDFPSRGGGDYGSGRGYAAPGRAAPSGGAYSGPSHWSGTAPSAPRGYSAPSGGSAPRAPSYGGGNYGGGSHGGGSYSAPRGYGGGSAPSHYGGGSPGGGSRGFGGGSPSHGFGGGGRHR